MILRPELATNWVKTHQPCPCGKSSDAFAIRPDGTGWCFSCKTNHSLAENEADGEETQAIPAEAEGTWSAAGSTFEYLPWRGITPETMRFFDVKTKIKADGRPYALAAPFGPRALQVRLFGEKRFWWKGDGVKDAPLFGMDRFERGGRSVAIYESWIDACSGYQIVGEPSVSVRSASSAGKDCGRVFEWLNSFSKILLALDNDEAGQKATEEIVKLFDYNKLYHVKLNRKDSNEYLSNGDLEGFRRAYFAAGKFHPEGIISSRTDFHKIIEEDREKPSIPYPFESWNDRTDGIRTGEFILVSADEGTGKTEILRAIEYFLLKGRHRCGIVHLEEDKARALKGLVGYELEQPVHFRDAPVSNEEINNVIDLLVGEDERLHLYSHFDSNDPDVILDRIRFMASSCGCRYIFLDHIGLLVSGLETDDERRKLDYISTRLALMVKKLDFTVFVASHVNKEGGIRGSTYPSKVAHLWIHLDRNLKADTEEERNITRVMINKNRWTGKTGPAHPLVFDPETFKISEGTELPT